MKDSFIGYCKGNIKVIGSGYKDKCKRKYECICLICGSTIYQTKSNILKMKGVACKNCIGSYRKTHGMKHTRIYNVWRQLKHRCNCPSDYDHYKNYGARNIKVCDEWQNDFMAFYNWAIANGWNEKTLYQSNRNTLTIDRIDNNKGYSPQNCRIITHRENQYNKRNTFTYIVNGKEYNLLELSKIYNLPVTTIKGRIKHNKSFTDEYNKQKLKKMEYNGKLYTYRELSEMSGLSKDLIKNRINKGWSVNNAVEIPLIKRRK